MVVTMKNLHAEATRDWAKLEVVREDGDTIESRKIEE